ncbi:hypothetical protein SCHPADRAFT_1002256 [Schizopora paradoxa]|uniref:Uncharacterized protein n=1 Tax=Schizopora paradoxa TaxID=27342 RepID=A0A0H2RP87_9AGAM|nr:hypothetical protein SCHPADRAFT_1002256 [Schizopora paradoxa]
MAKLTKAWRSSSDNKVPRESRTMALARTQYEEVQRDNSLMYPATGPTTVTHTVSELQWAVRAMTAEVKLSERERHHKEMTSMLMRMNYALLASVVAILLGMGILFGIGAQGNSTAQSKAAWRPHFTIPILSPFTSIVEHEMSKVGFRTTAVFLIISGVVIYFLVKHRMGR